MPRWVGYAANCCSFGNLPEKGFRKMNSIVSMWKNLQFPVVNAIAYGDDTVQWFDEPAEGGTELLLASDRVSIDFGVEDVENLIPLCEVVAADIGSVIVCGEGGWGGIGFVAVQAIEGDLRWLAIFDFSNPFVKIEQGEGDISATNNHGEIWHFPLDCPGRIRIDYSNSHRRHHWSEK